MTKTTEFPSRRLSPVSTSSQVDSGASGKPTRGGVRAAIAAMPLSVKISAVWLIFVVLIAIYAKIDTTFAGGALPLQDPNYQTNNFDPATGDFGDGEPLAPPSGEHWLGTDALARDIFSRLAHGAWACISVAVVASAVGLIVGGGLGSLVGFVRGRTETIVMAFADVILAFPAMVLLIAVLYTFDKRPLSIICLLIGFLSIPTYTRVARANSLSISNREFVMAARAIGTKSRTILWREIIPNVAPTMVSYAMVASAYVIVVEAALSFIGLSIEPPDATWGNMINLGRRDINADISQVLWPSVVLSLTVLALNQVGDFFQQRTAAKESAL